MKKLKQFWLYILVAVIFFFLGAVSFSIRLSNYKLLTEQLLYNFFTTHDAQNKLIQNYDRSYNLLADCFKQTNCDVEQSLTQMSEILDERQRLNNELSGLGKETEQILNEMNSY